MITCTQKKFSNNFCSAQPLLYFCVQIIAKLMYLFRKHELAFKRQKRIKAIPFTCLLHSPTQKSKHHKHTPPLNWLISCLCREFWSQMTRIQNINKNTYKYKSYCTSKTNNSVICEKQGQKDWNKIHVKCYKKRSVQRLFRITAVFRIRFLISVIFLFFMSEFRI